MIYFHISMTVSFDIHDICCDATVTELFGTSTVVILFRKEVTVVMFS